MHRTEELLGSIDEEKYPEAVSPEKQTPKTLYNNSSINQSK
jgi:hypothetical protein